MDSTEKTPSLSTNGSKEQAPTSEPKTEKSRSRAPSADRPSTETQEQSTQEQSSQEKAPGWDKASLSEKVDPATRFLAMLIDGLVAGVLSAVPFVGGIAGAAYLVVRDGLDLDFMDQRSLGKHLMGLRVARLDGKPMDIETSARRNWMWGIGAITGALVYIPILGWVLIPFVALAGLAIGLYEGYRVWTDAEGRRWGDMMAQTKVYE